MARILALILATTGCLGGASKSASAPKFDLCWTRLPPGSEFNRQISEYIGTTDALTITASGHTTLCNGVKNTEFRCKKSKKGKRTKGFIFDQAFITTNKPFYPLYLSFS